MKIDCKEGDNHVNLHFKGERGADVHFNGIRWVGPPYISAADDEEGWIDVEILDAKGMPFLLREIGKPLPDENSRFLYGRLWGKVEFKGERRES